MRDFLRRVLSDDGEPSSSRILTVYLSIVVSVLLTIIVIHLVRLHDPAMLSLWLTALPGITLGFLGLATAPYAVNRTSTSLSDIIRNLRGGGQQ